MAHILPHWTWPPRVGQVTPVHVFTSGDEADLFLNGKSLGRKKKGEYEYRLRWDDVVYEPGELKVITYKNGQQWAEDVQKTAGTASAMELMSERDLINADRQDLAFIRVRITDQNGITIPRADNLVRFSLQGPGLIVATDNGDPTDLVPFPSHERKAFNGYCLAIVGGISGRAGTITLKAESDSLKSATVLLRSISE
jgi:beta-galactosidase